MNPLLQLKGTLHNKKFPGNVGAPTLPKGAYVELRHIEDLVEQLRDALEIWEKYKVSIDPLISICYTSVVAKSNRMQAFLKTGGNDSIVGIRFIEEGIKRHLVTHRVSKSNLKGSVERLESLIDYFRKTYGERMSQEQLQAFTKQAAPKLPQNVTKTTFAQIVKDAYYMNDIRVFHDAPLIKGQALISLYDVNKDVGLLLKELGITVDLRHKVDDFTFLLSEDDYKEIVEKAPYLIAMGLCDLSEIELDVEEANTNKHQPELYPIITIPDPENEPTIGVIDTLFDERVYFSKWVTYEELVHKDLPMTNSDTSHGTAVTSLIVDGPSFNPHLDDGCGRFKVKHFGVALNGPNSTYQILKHVEYAVKSNRHIKVWNLSLGSEHEIFDNFISPEGALLDRLQREYDVVFIVAGTNKTNKEQKKIGAPADSINSIVVNSIGNDGRPASYTREGIVLSFFIKPDISYYGGTQEAPMVVCQPYGKGVTCGTSYAAPWIARKMAYMIHILGFSKETAKALLVDAATGWDKQVHASQKVGYGPVPIRIEEIVKSKPDEIKFIVEGQANAYETYAYNIPTPIDDGKLPYIAKATLTYFPSCSRNQGVDYTDTELDIHFGRVKKDNSLDTINDNKQSEEGLNYLYEEEARKLFRKWDNVKHIREFMYTDKGRLKQTKKILNSNLWGLNIKRKTRHGDSEAIPFSVVVTLKDLTGSNRIETFIQQCSLKGWLVQTIDVEQRVTIYEKLEEEIELS